MALLSFTTECLVYLSKFIDFCNSPSILYCYSPELFSLFILLRWSHYHAWLQIPLLCWWLLSSVRVPRISLRPGSLLKFFIEGIFSGEVGWEKQDKVKKITEQECVLVWRLALVWYHGEALECKQQHRFGLTLRIRSCTPLYVHVS